MQRGICFDHNEICDLVREKALFEIRDKIEKNSLWVSLSFYNNKITAIVTHANGVSHLEIKGGNNK